ncbi:hypothetical protein BGZ73_004813 [Actinomortierella ambigua]|nr:hypothetical protein BGZ73_004813 [Actinomortierella ambigua]
MACRFFRSIPDAIPVRDPYEEVFLVFTGEGTSESGDGTQAAGGGPWQHNRSVSQTSNTLEVELAFTPVPTPPMTPTLERSSSSSMLVNHLGGTGSASSSRPSSRPGSRAGLRGVAVNNSMAEENSASQEALLAHLNNNNNNSQNGSGSGQPLASSSSRSGGSRSGSRRPGAKGSGSSSPAASSPPTFGQQPLQKPLVIHQSLSTLSQPGQTGSVVWDSSILMAKFLLSIRELQLDHFLRVGPMRTADEIRSEGEGGGRENDVNDDDIAFEDDEEEEEEEDMDDDEGWQTRLVFDPRSTSILELGSGCGLLGIVLVELCRRLLLTDQSAVLPLLMKNLKKNLDKRYFAQNTTSTSNSAQQAKRDKSSSVTSSPNNTAAPLCQLQIQELVWGQDLDVDLKRGVGFDFVIATDVIYNEAIIPLLVRTLAELCRVRERARREERMDMDLDVEEGQSRGERPKKLAKTVVLLAQELRTDYVHLSFLEKMKAEGFRMVRMPLAMLDPEFHGGYVIYACWLR